jgi:phage terminase large subunit-like protein
VVYDSRFFEVPARLLEAEGIQVIEFSQSADQMAPACGLTYKMILEKRIVHGEDPLLARHVKSATSVPMERGGFVLKKGRSKGKIDACIAMIMGVATLHALPKRKTAMFARV